jgi:predicted O-methyltransferase YrrM
MASSMIRASVPGAAGSAVRKAILATALGRQTEGEREWSARIERRRSRLVELGGPTGVPRFEAHPDGGGEFQVSEAETTLGFAAAVMSLSREWSLLLMRLVRERAPRSCLELGTGFGISAAYQAAALELGAEGRLVTLEGAAEWAAVATEGLTELGLSERAQCRVGPLAETLPATAESLAPIDFVFVDAEHQKRPTLEHFHTLMPHLAGRAVLVFDDVDWPGVRAAHDEIARDPRIAASMRSGRFGISVVSQAGAH